MGVEFCHYYLLLFLILLFYTMLEILSHKSLDNPLCNRLYYWHAIFVVERLLNWILLKVLDCSLINWLM